MKRKKHDPDDWRNWLVFWVLVITIGLAMAAHDQYQATKPIPIPASWRE